MCVIPCTFLPGLWPALIYLLHNDFPILDLCCLGHTCQQLLRELIWLPYGMLVHKGWLIYIRSNSNQAAIHLVVIHRKAISYHLHWWHEWNSRMYTDTRIELHNISWISYIVITEYRYRLILKISKYRMLKLQCILIPTCLLWIVDFDIEQQGVELLPSSNEIM